jgi:acetylornithine deacetylase/succinyl-diaminopimelate desuccinylase-like protein
MATTAPATELTAQERRLIEQARSMIDAAAVGDICYALTEIASPTGEELALAEFVADHVRRAGAQARVSRVGDGGASVLASYGSGGDGPTVWIYAPLDTSFSGNPDEDRPWLGDQPRADFSLPPQRAGGKVIGMGAENPKGFAAAGIAAFEALARSRASVRGRICLALAGGSMPINHRPGHDAVVGHGVGISQLLSEEPRPDFAIVLKPGYAVNYEEVGLAWFRVTIRGAINYTGIRHKGTFRNPIVAAAKVVDHLEAWFPEFTAAHTSGLVAPQGSINAIRAGSADRAAFIPATAELDLDLRVAPDSSPEAVQRELEGALDALRQKEPDLEVELERTAALPGTRTDPESWIVVSLIRAWEDLEDKPHEFVGRGSGATDAALLRSHGIETARIGLPVPKTPSPYSGFSMGVADEESMARLATLLVHTLVEAGSRSRAEVRA